MRVDGVEMCSSAVHAAEHERGGDLPLVLKKPPLQLRHGRHDARLSARLPPQQLQLTRDQLRNALSVRGRARAAAVNVGRDVVDLLAVLVADLQAEAG